MPQLTREQTYPNCKTTIGCSLFPCGRLFSCLRAWRVHVCRSKSWQNSQLLTLMFAYTDFHLAVIYSYCLRQKREREREWNMKHPFSIIHPLSSKRRLVLIRVAGSAAAYPSSHYLCLNLLFKFNLYCHHKAWLPNNTDHSNYWKKCLLIAHNPLTLVRPLNLINRIIGNAQLY